jgi:hypothetical protein
MLRARLLWFQAVARRPSAMLWYPARLSGLMTRFRMIAMARGAVPARVGEAFSVEVTSRMWWSALMCQWLRMVSARSVGEVCSGVRLVIPRRAAAVMVSSGRWR